jgi:hypothetical protein
VDGAVSIGSNAALRALTGLDALTAVGEGFDLSGNASLTDSTAVSQLAVIGGDLFLSVNASLADVDGFSGLTSLGGMLFLFSNNALVDLRGLRNLADTGGVVFFGNAQVRSVDELASLTTVRGDLAFDNNPSLCVSSIRALLGRLVGFTGAITGAGNDTGC